jgi:hypothetical protein
MLACPNKQIGEDALKTLTLLTNHLLAGRAPRELAPYIAGAPLMALNKPGGGLRPIAIGETIRRLVSKCCCWEAEMTAPYIFGSLQVGVATKGGGEAVIHAVRKIAKELGDDPSRVMLKVDLTNAFNMVDRTEMLRRVREQLPNIYHWTKYCYAQPAHLFFGDMLLASMAGVQQGDPLGPVLFSLVLHPLVEKIQKEFPNLDLNVWYLDDGTIIGKQEDVYGAFELLRREGPALGLHLNVKKNELWWPSRAAEDPFPKDVIRVENSGVKLLGAPIGTTEYTTNFISKKLVVLKQVCETLEAVNDAQIEFGLFRGCLAYNKINHLLRTCPPDILAEVTRSFDDHFQEILEKILRVKRLEEDVWEHASLPTRFAGLGVTQTKTVAGAAYMGSCALTYKLVAALLQEDPASYVPDGMEDLLAQHKARGGRSYDFPRLCELSLTQRVQRLLSDELHDAALQGLKERSTPRTKNLLLACTMGHSSDWLLTAPIPGLGLSMPSHTFRTALKFRLGIPLFDEGLTCPVTSRKHGRVCGEVLDIYGDHALCCHFGTSRVFRHNHLRDILGHAARGAGLSAVVIEKKNQITGTSKKPGDITVQQYHRGFASTAFDVTVAHPLQKKHQGVAMDEAGVAAEEAHDNKLKKHLEDCKKEGLQFVPLAWESTGGATATVHKTLGKWTGLESERGGYPLAIIRQNLYAQVSCCLQRHLAQCVLDRQPERGCSFAL